MRTSLTWLCSADLSVEQRGVRALLSAVLFACLALVCLVPPERMPLPECLFQSLTGHSCMTCGLTRSLHAMAHGQMAAALGRHLFGPAVFLGMIAYCAAFLFEAVTGRKAVPRVNGRLLVSIAILWLFYWAARLAAEF